MVGVIPRGGVGIRMYEQLQGGSRSGGGGGCVYCSLPDLVSLATSQALGNPEVSSIRNTWILISKNRSELKGQAL